MSDETTLPPIAAYLTMDNERLDEAQQAVLDLVDVPGLDADDLDRRLETIATVASINTQEAIKSDAQRRLLRLRRRLQALVAASAPDERGRGGAGWLNSD